MNSLLSLIICGIFLIGGAIIYNIEMTEVPPLSQGIGIIISVLAALALGFIHGCNLEEINVRKK